MTSYGSNLEGCLIIGDDNYEQHLGETVVDDEIKGFGLIPRDLEKAPMGSYEKAPEYDPARIPLVDMDTLPERIREREATKATLARIRRHGNNGGPIPSLDQNGQGYCWFYSVTGLIQLLRAIAGEPYVMLSGHSGACKIKGFRDQGGWSPMAAEFVANNGIVPTSLWPAKSMSRSHDTAANWAEAEKYKATESWMDLKYAAYNRSLTMHQTASLLVAGIPCTGDFNWWRHSVLLMDLLDVYPNRSARDWSRYGVKGLNSWTDRYGDLGEFVLKDSRAQPNGGCAPRVALAA